MIDAPAIYGECLSFGAIPLRLKALLHEISAAEEAKQRGWVSSGYGKWVDPSSGKTVARTVNDKLVLVAPDDVGTGDTNAQEPEQAKPTTMSAADAGTDADDAVREKDIKKIMKGEPSEDPNTPAQQPPHVAQPNKFRAPPLQFGKPVDRHSITALYKNHRNASLADEIIIGEEVIKVTHEELYAFLDDIEPNDNRIPDVEAIRRYKESAITQVKTWRDNLDPVVFDEVFEAQMSWQAFSQYHLNDSERIPRNTLFNNVCAGPPPASLDAMAPIERGMAMSAEDAAKFLKQFHIGEDLDFPPSGFSMQPTIAREFAMTSRALPAGVILRLAPNRDGKVYGLHLSQLDKSEHFAAMPWESMRAVKNFDHEKEVIRPSGPRARCVGVRKLITDPVEEFDGTSVRVTYIIDLEEQGYPDGFVQESINFNYYVRQQPNTVFERLMNTSIHNTKQRMPPMQESFNNIMLEGKAAEQAHKMKLVSAGGAYWQDSTGKIVAKTVNDQLIKITPDEHTQFNVKGNAPPSHTPAIQNNSLQGDATIILAKKIGNALGTNAGGTYLGSDGVTRYVKFYDNPDQSYGEVLANKMYIDTGVGAPESVYFKHNGKVCFASTLVPNQGTVGEVGLHKSLAQNILTGFVMDCLAANWDVLGQDFDNIVVTSNNLIPTMRIDNGSAFLRRAMGELKPVELLNKLPEWEVFSGQLSKDTNLKNSKYASVFKTAGISIPEHIGTIELRDQMNAILSLHNKSGGWHAYVQKIVPDLSSKEQHAIVAMLYHRTKLLLEKIK